MYCDRCGAELQLGQKFCGSCGKPAGLAVTPVAAGGRVARHLQLLAILWIAASALNLIGALVLFLLSGTLFRHLPSIPEASWVGGFLHGLFSVLGYVVLLKSLVGFAAGWGLMQRESWARPLTLVLGFISLLHIPLGTALGIYTIWVLLSPQGDQEYQQLSRAA